MDDKTKLQRLRDFVRKRGKAQGFHVDEHEVIIFKSRCLIVTFHQDSEGRFRPLRAFPVSRASLGRNLDVDLCDPETAAKRLTRLWDELDNPNTETGKASKRDVRRRAVTKARISATMSLAAGKTPRCVHPGKKVRLSGVFA